MKPSNTNHAIWLGRGEALGLLLRLLRRGLRAGVSQLRNLRLARRLRELAVARRRLPEG